jgi:PAS domain S-box-containing protein
MESIATKQESEGPGMSISTQEGNTLKGRLLITVNAVLSRADEILIVDDAAEDIKLLAHILDGAGYRVRTAGDGKSGVHSVQTSQPDLILLKMEMRGMDGCEVCRLLKGDEHSRNIPVIFVGSFDEARAKVKGFEAGGVDYIAKPFQAVEVLARVQTHLALRHMEEQQEALRESEEKYRTLFEESFDGLFITSPTGKILEMNKKGVMMFGYDTKEEVLSLDLERDVYAYPPDRKRILAMVNTRGTAEYEVVVKKKSGEKMLTYCSLTGAKDEKGEITSYRGIIRDITEHKLMEEEIRQTNTYLENIFENSPDAIGIVDKSGGFIRWNKMAAELYGYTFEELRGVSGFDLYADQDELERMLRQLSREGLVKKWEMRMKRRDGSVVPFEISIALLKDSQNETLGSVCVARDLSEIKAVLTALKTSHDQLYNEITEHKQAKEAIEQLRRRNELILNSAGEGILGLDLEGKLTFVNPAAAEMLGYKAEELIGRSDHGLYHHTREDGRVYPEEECPVYQAFRDGKFCPLMEEVFWRKDGTSFPVRYSSAPIIEDGRVVGAVINFRDITERRLVEKEKERLESQLRQVQKLEAIGTLAGGIAHDFNNVLGIIMGYTDLIGLHLPEESKEKEHLGALLKACRRAKDLVRQILTFSRSEDGLERRPVDIRPIIKESLKFLRASLPTTIEIRQNISITGGMILAHPTQIHQVLTNLCTNAAHAMEEKGGVLEVSLTDLDLTPGAVPPHSDMIPGLYMRLTVSDTGHGMPSATLERIFDPYFTTKGIGKGTGLGLPIVHGIVKGYGGAITVSSEIGKGTTFHVYLPTSEGDLIVSDEVCSPIPRGTERILFVDDEMPLIDLWQKSLGRLGYNVVIATDSLQALQLFRAHPEDFDLVMTDYTMPKMTGIDLAEQMMRVRPDILVILCTGVIEWNMEEKAKEMGIRAFLRKPMEVRKTAEEIRKVLEQK